MLNLSLVTIKQKIAGETRQFPALLKIITQIENYQNQVLRHDPNDPNRSNTHTSLDLETIAKKYYKITRKQLF